MSVDNSFPTLKYQNMTTDKDIVKQFKDKARGCGAQTVFFGHTYRHAEFDLLRDQQMKARYTEATKEATKVDYKEKTKETTKETTQTTKKAAKKAKK